MKKIIFITTLLFLTVTSYATHIIGGEISYHCLGGNLFEFKIKIYRDCFNGVPPLDAPAYITIFDASNQIIYNDSVSLLTDSLLPIISPSACLLASPDNCVEEGTYVFQTILPASPGGYTVVYQRCCRSGSIMNLTTPGSQGSTYLIELNDSALSMCNSSPSFLNYPPVVICGGEPLVFDHSAIDPDGDSLVYELCQPFNGATGTNSQPVTADPPPYIGVSYLVPYTSSDPMDGNPPLNINPSTGLLTITPTALWQFVVGVCVKEYRNGNYLGKYFRDFQFNVLNCQQIILIDGIVSNQYLTEGANALFTATSSNTTATFQWQENVGTGFVNLSNGGQYSGVTNDTLNILGVTVQQNNNSYRCFALNSSCTDTSNIGLLEVYHTGIEQLKILNAATVHPNPSSGLFTVTLVKPIVFKTLKIENILGQIIFEKELRGESSLKIQLPEFAKGIYMIRLYGENAIANKQIVIQ